MFSACLNLGKGLRDERKRKLFLGKGKYIEISQEAYRNSHDSFVYFLEDLMIYWFTFHLEIQRNLPRGLLENCMIYLFYFSPYPLPPILPKGKEYWLDRYLAPCTGHLAFHWPILHQCVALSARLSQVSLAQPQCRAVLV